jgi:hypothetical protein
MNTSSNDHTHSCATTTSSYSNLPPCTEVIYGQRKDPSTSSGQTPAANISVGIEQVVSGGFEDAVTHTYLYRKYANNSYVQWR